MATALRASEARAQALLDARPKAPSTQVPARNLEELVRLAAIVDATDEAIISATLDTTIVTWNRGAERIFGFSAAEMIGQSVTRMAPPERQQEMRGVTERVLRGEHVAQFETERLRQDGTLAYVAVTVTPLRDQHGEVIGGAVLARDMTDRHRMEESLRASEAHLRYLVSASPIGMCVLDEHGNFEQVNAAYVEMLGYTAEELLGNSFAIVVATEHQASARAAFQQSLSSGAESITERVLHGKDGRDHAVLSTNMILPGPDGRPAGSASWWISGRESAMRSGWRQARRGFGPLPNTPATWCC